MVAANEAVARALAEADVPLLYRCHPLPDASKAERFAKQLPAMGLDVPFELPATARQEADAGQSLLDALKAGGGRMQLFGDGLGFAAADGNAAPAGEEVTADVPEAAKPQGFAALTPAEREAWLAPFQGVVQALLSLGTERAEVATLKLLACMGRAYYTPSNEGHFGLASTHYCHFTSPIRRYPDLVVHRNLKAHLAGQSLPHVAADLERLCDHCSDQERAAAALERRVTNAALVLASLRGDTAFSTAAARVTGITPASLFVLLQGGIEARVAARDLPGGPYHVDEWESMLYLSDREAPQRFDAADLRTWTDWYDEELGEVRRVRARLGDAITVRLAGRDVCDGKTGAEVMAWRT
jgi:exoribonuclease R